MRETSREPIFQTEGGGPVLRRHIMSLDHNADVDPIVVQAWERICIHTFKQYGRFYRTCLSTVSKVLIIDVENTLYFRDHDYFFFNNLLWLNCSLNIECVSRRGSTQVDFQDQNSSICG